MFSPISATLRMVCLNAHTTESMNILNCGGGICKYAVGAVWCGGGIEKERERERAQVNA